jgi:hypothetical protein
MTAWRVWRDVLAVCDLCGRIVNAVALVDVTFLNKLLDKLEYHLDVCRNLEVLTGAL